jgi:hypothetical protein
LPPQKQVLGDNVGAGPQGDPNQSRSIANTSAMKEPKQFSWHTEVGGATG